MIIEISAGNGGFRFHNVLVAVVAFLDNSLRFCAGGNLVHLPEKFFKNRFFGIVYRGNLLRTHRVGDGLDRIDGKHLRPDGAGAEHLQHIVTVRGFHLIQTILVFGIVFTHHGLHGLACASVLAGKENADHRCPGGKFIGRI